MLSYNKLYRTIFKTLQHFAICFISVTSAEEASVLSNATVIGSELNSTWCSDPNNIINGSFKIWCESYGCTSADVKKEFVIDLIESKTLHTVFIVNRYHSR